MSDHTPSLAAAAAWWAAQGVPVLPLRPGGKVPALRGGNGCHDATTDLDQVRRWWQHMPTANIGLATGHRFDVVDLDGPAGQETRDRLAERFASLEVLATVATPRGEHLYVPSRPGMGNRTGWPGRGVDYRGRGRYVVAPPSVRPEGAYRLASTSPRFLADQAADLGGAPQAEFYIDPPAAPAAPRQTNGAAPPPTQQPGKPGNATARLAGILRWLAAAIEGERNKRLFAATCTLCKAVQEGAGIDLDRALDLVADVALGLGLDRLEVERTIESATRNYGVWAVRA